MIPATEYNLNLCSLVRHFSSILSNLYHWQERVVWWTRNPGHKLIQTRTECKKVHSQKLKNEFCVNIDPKYSIVKSPYIQWTPSWEFIAISVFQFKIVQIAISLSHFTLLSELASCVVPKLTDLKHVSVNGNFTTIRDKMIQSKHWRFNMKNRNRNG